MKHSKIYYCGVVFLLLTLGCGKNSSRINTATHGPTPESKMIVSSERSSAAPVRSVGKCDSGVSERNSPVLNEILYRQKLRQNEASAPRAKIDWSLPQEKAEKTEIALTEQQQPVVIANVTEPKQENVIAVQPEKDRPVETVTADRDHDVDFDVEHDIAGNTPPADTLFEENIDYDDQEGDIASSSVDLLGNDSQNDRFGDLDLEWNPHDIAKKEHFTAETEYHALTQQNEETSTGSFVAPHAIIEEWGVTNTENLISEEDFALEHDIASLAMDENWPEIPVYRPGEKSSIAVNPALIQIVEQTEPETTVDLGKQIDQSVAESLKKPNVDLPPPWAYGTLADSFLSSSPTPIIRVVNNMQDYIDPNDDPFSLGFSTEAPADSGGEEATPHSDPFGGSDDSALTEEMKSSKEDLEDKSQAVPRPVLSEEELAKHNARPEELSAVEEYLLNEADRSPVHMMESIGKLVQMQKPELVNWLLRRFLQKDDLVPEDYARITESVRPEAFNRLISDPLYAPDGPILVEHILKQTEAFRESKVNIEKAVDVYTQSTDAAAKEAAIQVILKGRQKGIEVLLDRLIRSNDQNEIVKVSALLARMGDDARLAVTELLLLRNESSMRAAAILAQIGKKSDTKLLIPLVYDAKLSESNRQIIEGYIKKLVGRVPSPQQAATQLYTDAMNYFRARVPFRTRTDYQDNAGASAVSNNRPQVGIWMFREGDLLPHFALLNEKEASRYYAEKYAREAAFLAPNNSAYRTLWLSTYFDLKGRETGIDESIYTNEKMLRGILDAYPLAEIENVLRFSMTHDHPIAARVAVELLGQIGTAEELLYKPNAPMVRAAGFSDRRVRFAAVKAIIGLNPQKPYPGSSVVADALVYFTKSGGIKKAIVASPKTFESQQIASMLLPLGYKSETANTGKDAMRLAINSADTELMMIDTRTPSKGMNYLLQELYLDNRTHDVPVAVYASEGDEARGAKAVVGAARARAYYRPHDEATVREIIDHLMTETGVEHVPVDVRLQSAKDAVYWITQLFKQPGIYRFENIEEAALQIIWTPELVMEAMDLLSLIRSVHAQLMLTGIASESLNPIDRRTKAVDAFEESVRKHGVLLRGRQVLDLYDFYNASAGEPKESQELRGRLLDVIEDFADRISNNRR